MCSNAFKIDSRLKKYQVMTGYIKWEHDLMMRSHRIRIKNIKPAIDNKCPNRGPFKTLNTKKMRLQEDRINKIERKNRVIIKRLREINEVKLPEFCHRKLRFLIRGDAYKLKPPSGRKEFKYDWEALRGSLARRSLRKQETALRRLINSQNISKEEAFKLKKFLPRTQEVPVEYLDYHRHDHKSGEGVPVSESVKYVENDEPEGLLTKLAAIRLHMHYGDWVPGPESPYLDFHTKHKKIL
ncbi:hypothetical protein KP509_26G067100 [Ceratopteris richardii]|uniref:Uncharacterized protein n=1 Tax=Ceratopteris richardii TaxID=49495 RepID=A0A8T2RMV4_CERRI|nr:hypothetical protein KP509_26G067100 [Ceratopteris richardii]KAH7297379.1 hypothetical protein KP509_26G067100 [Ceratopteris richardii]KAH7297380.1 hypothetical protein KP509_26G067100 [Ceratopteris richardii]KAH7297381.1 hypothetical protein KP509_26G067100 [Ceratopteris richardii]